MKSISVKRPIMRYHGGKWRMAKFIIQHMPPHKIYVEPFGGAASVLMQKPRVYGEIYNELDENISNVFEVLRDEKKAMELKRKIELTPYSLSEFRKLIKANPQKLDAVERARRTLFLSQSGFSSDTATRSQGQGFRAVRMGLGNYHTAAIDWMKYPHHLKEFIERLRGVVITCFPAIECIEKYDSPQTLFYVDPPYVHSTRTNGARGYRFEMSNADHVELASVLHNVKGMVLLSGFRCDLYDDLYKTWRRLDIQMRGQSSKGVKLNTESLWLSNNVPTANEVMEFV